MPKQNTSRIYQNEVKKRLAIFAICDYNKISPELSIFIASIAAATSVASLGNSKYIEKNLMLKSIEYFLK